MAELESVKRKRFQISEELDAKLTSYCKVNGLSQSEAVQYALELLFQEDENKNHVMSYQDQLLNMILESLNGLGHQMAADNQKVENQLEVLIKHYDGVSYMATDNEEEG